MEIFAIDKPIFVIDRFSEQLEDDGLPKGWRPLTFRKIERHTKYSIEHENDDYFVKAESKMSASGIYKEIEINPQEYPYLNWRWQISNIIQKGDARQKNGDDYPARIYVTFKFDPNKVSFIERIKYSIAKKLYGRYPPKNAISYIWANQLPKGMEINSPYTNKVKIVAVESGVEKLNQWVQEERNVYEDYKNLFQEEPPIIDSIFLMTDSDNTGERATAYYDDIIFHRK